MDLATLHSLEQKPFTAVLADIFEHSAWVAERVWGKRPFADVDALHAAMVAAVNSAGFEPQLALLRAHPQLAGKEAKHGELTSASQSEQAGAQLNRLSSAEMAAISRFNQAYMDKFSFPFIIAVRNHTKASIFSEFEHRIENTVSAERTTALQQVAMIARFRLEDLLKATQ